jgi:site-specific recombinase XerD
MINNVFSRASLLAELESGPLGPYPPDLVSALQQQRYATHTIQKYLHAADAFGRWLITHLIALSEVNEAVIVRYVSTFPRRKVPGYAPGAPPHEAAGLKHLLTLLRQQGVTPLDQPCSPTTPMERTLADYEQFLERTCGAAVTTRRRYLYFARQFLSFAFGSSTPEWSALRAETITKFVQQETVRRSGFGRKAPGSAIRIFLRYLVTQGVLPAGLEAAVPGMRVWKHASLPEHLTVEEVTRLLTACADGTAIGKRNHAILLLLARLGIRAFEAARLQVTDVDWRAGSVVIRASKNHRERSLPLPEEVGQALVDYLRNGRPTTSSRDIFLAHTAPFQPLRTAYQSGQTPAQKNRHSTSLFRRPSVASHGCFTDGLSRRQFQGSRRCVRPSVPANHAHLRQTRSNGASAGRFALAGRCAMIKDDLQRRLDSYLAIRDALGFRMQLTRILLMDFVQYLDELNLTGPIHAQAAIDWATSGSVTRGPGGQAARLSQVRVYSTRRKTNVIGGQRWRSNAPLDKSGANDEVARECSGGVVDRARYKQRRHGAASAGLQRRAPARAHVELGVAVAGDRPDSERQCARRRQRRALVWKGQLVSRRRNQPDDVRRTSRLVGLQWRTHHSSRVGRAPIRDTIARLWSL